MVDLKQQIRTVTDIMIDLLKIVEEEAEWVDNERINSYGELEPYIECPECGADGSVSEPKHAEHCARHKLISEAKGFILVEFENKNEI